MPFSDLLEVLLPNANISNAIYIPFLHFSSSQIASCRNNPNPREILLCELKSGYKANSSTGKMRKRVANQITERGETLGRDLLNFPHRSRGVQRVLYTHDRPAK